MYSFELIHSCYSTRLNCSAVRNVRVIAQQRAHHTHTLSLYLWPSDLKWQPAGKCLPRSVDRGIALCAALALPRLFRNRFPFGWPKEGTFAFFSQLLLLLHIKIQNTDTSIQRCIYSVYVCVCISFLAEEEGNTLRERIQ